MKDSDNDWRMEDVFFLSEDTRLPSGQIAKKGSQITKHSVAQLTRKKQVVFALPNATALFLNASRRSWEEAKSIRQRSKIDHSIKSEVTFATRSESFNYLERVMESVVMAHTALEAFVNEKIPDDFLYHTHRKSPVILETMNKKEIERYLSLDEKLSDVLPECLGIASPKGTRCWEGFVKLKRVRNRIIHMKKEDRRSSGPEIPTLWHALFKLDAPFRQAKSVCDFFIKNAQNDAPRWHREYPDK